MVTIHSVHLTVVNWQEFFVLFLFQWWFKEPPHELKLVKQNNTLKLHDMSGNRWDKSTTFKKNLITHAQILRKRMFSTRHLDVCQHWRLCHRCWKGSRSWCPNTASRKKRRMTILHYWQELHRGHLTEVEALRASEVHILDNTTCKKVVSLIGALLVLQAIIWKRPWLSDYCSLHLVQDPYSCNEVNSLTLQHGRECHSKQAYN